VASKFRHAFYKLVPEHFARGEGELVLYALTRILDAYDAIFRDGLQARFPSYAGAKALELIGADRGIFRGRSETTTHYVARLRRWRYPRGHRTRGSAFALLEQVSEYWGGMTVATYDVNQTAHGRSADGTQETFLYDTGWDWDGVGLAAMSRFWLVLVPGTDVPSIIAWPTMGTGLTWGGGTFRNIAARSVTLGQQGVTPGDIRAMRRLFTGTFQWKPAGTRTDYAILDLDGAAVVPGGLWGTVRGRVTNARNTLRFWRVGTVVIP
jgi:hypothetical protein